MFINYYSFFGMCLIKSFIDTFLFEFNESCWNFIVRLSSKSLCYKYPLFYTKIEVYDY